MQCEEEDEAMKDNEEGEDEDDDDDKERVDISKQFGCPFPIYSDEEGTLYTRLRRNPVTPPRYFDWEILDSLGIHDSITEYLVKLSLFDYAVDEIVGYSELCLEMLCTLKINKARNVMKCRLFGEKCSIDIATMNSLFGFSSPHMCATQKPRGFNNEQVWEELTGFPNWSNQGNSSGFLKDPVLVVLHKFIAFNISGKCEANKVNATELFLLWTAKNDRRICATSFLWKHMENIQKRPTGHASFSQIATVLARHFQRPFPANLEVVPTRFIDYSELKNGFFLDSTKKFIPFEKRPCVKALLNAQAIAERVGGAGTLREAEEATVDATCTPHTSKLDTHFPTPPCSVPPLSSSQLSGFQALQEDLRSFRAHYDRTFTAFSVGMYARMDRQESRMKALEDKLDAWTRSYPRPPPPPPPDQDPAR